MCVHSWSVLMSLYSSDDISKTESDFFLFSPNALQPCVCLKSYEAAENEKRKKVKKHNNFGLAPGPVYKKMHTPLRPVGKTTTKDGKKKGGCSELDSKVVLKYLQQFCGADHSFHSDDLLLCTGC